MPGREAGELRHFIDLSWWPNRHEGRGAGEVGFNDVWGCLKPVLIWRSDSSVVLLILALVFTHRLLGWEA